MARRGLGDDRYLTFSQVELGGLEPPTPCLQTGGSRSTGVYRRRSASQDVRPGPVRSGCVAVLSGCTHRQVPQQPRNVTGPPAASPGSSLRRVVTRRPKGACHGFDLTLLADDSALSRRMVMLNREYSVRLTGWVVGSTVLALRIHAAAERSGAAVIESAPGLGR
jgi:hypothetical protein